MKTHINVVIDVEVYIELKNNKVNISKLVNDFLIEYNKIEKPKIEGSSLNDKMQDAKLKVLILNNEIEKLKKEQEAINKDFEKKHKGVRWIN